MAFFRVAGASEYLAITGWRIDDVKLTKKAWVCAGQRCKRFSIAPVNYHINVDVMSAEKLPFMLPAVFTIGPRADDQEALLLYAKLVAPLHRHTSHVDSLVRGIVEGETRVLAASMTTEEVFQGSKSFKQAVLDKVQLEINKFGLVIYNANVKQLVDEPGKKYFSYLGQKKQQEAANQAKVDVAEAKMKGNIGEKNMEGITRRNDAKVDAETHIFAAQQQGEVRKEDERVRSEVRVFEAERKAEVEKAEAELRKLRIGWNRSARIAETEAMKAVEIRDAEMQVEVERRNAVRQTEKLKAEHLSKAVVDHDVKVQQSNTDFYRRKKAADALLYEKEKEAEARKADAEAELFAQQKEAEASKAKAEAERFARQHEADAQLYAKRREAEGLVEMGKAQSEYILSMLQALGGNYGALRDYLMVSAGAYQEMARINADAIRGLEPKISILNKGDDVAAGAMNEVAGVYKLLPSLQLTTVHEQTRMQTPAWVEPPSASTQGDDN